MGEHVKFRLFKESDIPALMEMAVAEGWGYSDIDCKVGLKIDPQGITVAEDESGQQLGFLGHFNMDVDMVYIDIFITRSDVRRKGIGKRLWQEMLRKNSDKTIVLDAVMEMVPWYRKQGFVFEEYQVHIYKGTVSRSTVKETVNQTICKIRAFSEDDWPQLLEYDKQAHSKLREKSLRALFDTNWSVTIVALDEEDRLVGYANFHRKSDSGYNIRALYADSPNIAECLLENLLDKMTVGAKVALLLMNGKQLPKCIDDFKYIFSEQRMSTKRVEKTNVDTIYITTAHII